MASSARVTGLILVAIGLVLAVGVPAWLWSGRAEGTLEGSGLVLGLVGCYSVVVLPLIGGGVYFLLRGRAETAELADVAGQRKLLDIVSTRGKVSIADLVLELKSTRQEVQDDLHELVGRGLFSGYVDWKEGVLYSVEASKLQGQGHCPNCGGQLELAGKGLIECPYCGAEIFLAR